MRKVKPKKNIITYTFLIKNTTQALQIQQKASVLAALAG